MQYDSADTQAIGRVRRYGQQRTVQLYRCATPHPTPPDTAPRTLPTTNIDCRPRRFIVNASVDETTFIKRRADAEKLLSAAAEAGSSSGNA